MRFCRMCVLHDNIPNVTIDKTGICSVCRDHIENERISKTARLYLKSKLKKELNICKQNKHIYDAIVLFSGGKDSTFLLDMLQRTYGLKILALSTICPISMPTSHMNIDTVINKVGIDSMKIYIEEAMYKKLIKYALEEGYKIYPSEKLGCEMCSFLFKSYALNLALQLGIPFVFDGSDIAQTGKPIYIDGTLMKENAKGGIKPFGKLHDIFDLAFAGEYSGSLFEFKYEKYAHDAFPSYVSPFSFLNYDYRNNKAILDEMGLTQDKGKTLFTNCDAIPFFSYFSFIRYNAPVYIRTYASEIRTGYPFMMQSLIDNTRSATSLSRETISMLINEYREIVLYMSKFQSEISVPLEAKNVVLSKAKIHQEIYGANTCDMLYEHINKIQYYANYFDINLSNIV